MRSIDLEYVEKYEALESEFYERDRRFRRQQRRRRRPKGDDAAARAELTDLNDHVADFVPSYAAALDPKHHERKWIIDSLGGFYHDNLITDVTRIVKGGKEANVYACTAGPSTGVALSAAKLYRPRMLRHLRNDALYKEGRLVLDSDGKEVRGNREARAMLKKTRFGQHLGFMSWIMHEFEVQKELYAAGADVPKPIAQRDNALLMAFVGDEYLPAPTLSEIRLGPAEARPLFERVLANVRLMLDHHYVHGDLSAYNILYWEGQITIIDFPQLVDARTNRNALMLLERDVQRVCEYFERYGVASNPAGLARDMWQAYVNAW